MKPKLRSSRGDLSDKLASNSRSTGGSSNTNHLSKNDINLFNMNGALGMGGGSGGGSSGGGGNSTQSGGNSGGVGSSVVGSGAATAAAIRKRRSSINVYDQPSSLNSRLRQLETDMLRLDEDRTKLYDDTHSALASFELRVGEIHAILKSRQDNAEKNVEDMKMLLTAKDEFERQANSLNEKHERLLDKFMHRETVVARELKLLKNKFELLEKSRQFRAILQKSNAISDSSSNGLLDASAGAGNAAAAINDLQAGSAASDSGSRRNSQSSMLDISATALATVGATAARGSITSGDGHFNLRCIRAPIALVTTQARRLVRACATIITFPARLLRCARFKSTGARGHQQRQQAAVSSQAATSVVVVETAVASASDALGRRTSKVTPAAN